MDPIRPPEHRSVVTHADWLAEAERRFGHDPMKWRFRCPRCDTEQGLAELRQAGVPEDRIESVLAFSCIGRFNPGLGCDWTLGGVLRIHTLEIVYADGSSRPVFEFAGGAS